VTAARYALYAVPPADHPLWSGAADWLGRDPEAAVNRMTALPDWLGTARWREITAEPRLYGFHGTLKPPFALAADRRVGDLDAALADFAGGAPQPAPATLVVAPLSGFLALVPHGPAPALTALADRCVEHFDAFRAPPGEAELARRRRAGLTATQEAHLRRWGYPYVFDQFRYHMTLTGRLADPERERVRHWLAGRFAPAIAAPVPLDLALFEQPGRDRPFRLVRRYPLDG
jgi:putative phosphonate metabolism protein